MNRCGDCAHWQIGIKKVFRSVEHSFPMPLCGDNEGRCNGPGFMNSKTVPAGFGCLDFTTGNQHLIIEEYRDKDPWEVWEWVPCPEHPEGNPTIDGIEKRYGACVRCAGGGRVRKYGDGWLGDEQTQIHPAEVAIRAARIDSDIMAKARAEAKAEVERLTGIVLPPEFLGKDKPLPFA